MSPRLSRDLLARIALAVVDRDGAAALSMRRLAAELGVDPMAAYRHLPNKEALLDAVVDAVLAEVDLDAAARARDADGWRAGVRALTAEVHAALGRHPGAAPLLSARAWTTPHGWALIDWGLATMTAGGVDERAAVLAMNTAGLFLTALAQAEAGTGAVSPPDPDAHPTVAALLASGAGRFDYAELFGFFERLVFAGLDASVPDASAPDGAAPGPA